MKKSRTVDLKSVNEIETEITTKWLKVLKGLLIDIVTRALCPSDILILEVI